MSNEINKIKPVTFPTVWLTYRRRIKQDLDRAFASEGGPEYFNADFIARLSAQTKQLDEWLVKLFVFQIALTCFQVIGFFGGEASISIFGVTLRQAVGVKELLLGLYALVALVTWCVLISRDTTLTIIERAVELSSDEKFVHFAKLAAPTAFYTKFYSTRSYEDWVFATQVNKCFFMLVTVLAVIILLLLFVFSVAVNAAFFMDIYRNPTLGVWSTTVLAYVGLTMLFGTLLVLRLYLPMPFQDNSINMSIEALKDVDQKLYRRKLVEVYGPDSKYRRFTWAHRISAFAEGIKSSFKSVVRKCRSILRN